MLDALIGGLGASVPVLLRGSRSDELTTRFVNVWERCLALPASDVTAEPITLELNEPNFEDPTASGTQRAERTVTGDDLGPLLVSGTQTITSALIGAQRGNLLMFHAGAVSHPVTGASVVFVARGGTGKTTLSRTLGTRFGYLTDETAGITLDGSILAYPKPLSIRDPEVPHKVETGPSELALVQAHPAPFVTKIILLDRSPDDAPWIEELGLLDALCALTAESSSLAALDRGLHRLADLIERIGPITRWHYAEAADIIDPLAELLEGAA